MSLEVLGAMAPAPSLKKVRAGRDFIQKGMTGKSVEFVQRAVGVTPVTGNFSSVTYEAVKAYQRAKGLPDDGVVGTATLAAMEALPSVDRPLQNPDPSFDDFLRDISQPEAPKPTSTAPVKAAAAATAAKGCGAAGMTPQAALACALLVVLVMVITELLAYRRARLRRAAAPLRALPAEQSTAHAVNADAVPASISS
jgi:Putative peptidoglycan binding domain